MLKTVSFRDSYVSITWTLKYSSKNRLKPFGHFNAHIVLFVMFQLRSVVFVQFIYPRHKTDIILPAPCCHAVPLSFPVSK